MLLSLVLMVLWETAGRLYIMEETVLIAAVDIHEGQMVDPSMVTEGSFRREVLLEGALRPSSMETVTGLYATKEYRKNEILVEEDFCSKTDLYDGDVSVFPIPQEWIGQCTGSLRKYDRVRIVFIPERVTVGTYDVAFVRDTSGRELGQEETAYADLSQRTTGPEDVGTVEIICTETEYFNLYDLAENSELDQPCFLLIPEDVL